MFEQRDPTPYFVGKADQTDVWPKSICGFAEPLDLFYNLQNQLSLGFVDWKFTSELGLICPCVF